MVYIVLGIVAFLALWFGLHALARASAEGLRRVVLFCATLLGGALAGYLFLKGNVPLGSLVLGAVLGLYFPRRRSTAQARAAPFTAADPMTLEEACDILGVRPQANRQEIEAAYRALIKKLHPDSGGTDWFARRLTAAREFLLKQRR